MNLNWQREVWQTGYNGEERQGFTLTYVPKLRSLLLYGGTHSKPNDIYLYHIMEKKWRVEKTTFQKPSPRKYHTAYFSDHLNALIISGGEADKSRSLDDVDVLFIKGWQWKKLLFKQPFPARQFHTCTPINSGRDSLIFGGVCLPYGTFLNDVWIVRNIPDLCNTQTFQVLGAECQELHTKGQMPSGRYGHKSYYWDNNLYVFGGESEIREQSFSLYVLGISSRHWSKVSFNINLFQLCQFSLLPCSQNPSEVIILGGQFTNKKKDNRYPYVVTLKNRTIKKMKQIHPKIDQQLLDNCFPIENRELCGVGAGWLKDEEGYSLELYTLSQGGGIGQHPEPETIQSYLKAIKSEQILSQQLTKKVYNLELLYMEIQSYISTLYKGYSQSHDDDDQIQEEKQKQIEACLQLKQQYGKLEGFYQQNLNQIKSARKNLSAIDQNFRQCIQTEFDEDN